MHVKQGRCPEGGKGKSVLSPGPTDLLYRDQAPPMSILKQSYHVITSWAMTWKSLNIGSEGERGRERAEEMPWPAVALTARLTSGWSHSILSNLRALHWQQNWQHLFPHLRDVPSLTWQTSWFHIPCPGWSVYQKMEWSTEECKAVKICFWRVVPRLH